MELQKEIIIQTPVEQVWTVLGDQFAEVSNWASSVSHSEGLGRGQHGAPCSERGCSTSLGGLRERLTRFEPETYTLEYVVYDGLPSAFREAVNRWTLTPEGPGQTRVRSYVRFVEAGLLTKVLSPVLKWQMASFVGQILEELQYFVEQGRPHPRKLRAMRKAKPSTRRAS